MLEEIQILNILELLFTLKTWEVWSYIYFFLGKIQIMESSWVLFISLNINDIHHPL